MVRFGEVTRSLAAVAGSGRLNDISAILAQAKIKAALGI
jgi:hypothetical protein